MITAQELRLVWRKAGDGVWLLVHRDGGGAVGAVVGRGPYKALVSKFGHLDASELQGFHVPTFPTFAAAAQSAMERAEAAIAMQTQRVLAAQAEFFK